MLFLNMSFESNYRITGRWMATFCSFGCKISPLLFGGCGQFLEFLLSIWIGVGCYGFTSDGSVLNRFFHLTFSAVLFQGLLTILFFLNLSFSLCLAF